MVRELTRIISTYQDAGCLQSVLRAVRVLGMDGASKDELKLCETLTAITGHCLKEDTPPPVMSAALRTLECLVSGNRSNPELLLALWSSGHEPLFLVSRYVLHTDRSLQKRAISILYECAQHCDGKAALSRAGGIEALVRVFSDDLPGVDDSDIPHVIASLCLCCRDVHSRQKLRDCGGLQTLVDMLRDDRLATLHADILSALVCYYFDENTLRYMVRRLGLLKSLVYQLAQMAAKAKKEEKEEEVEVEVKPSLRPVLGVAVEEFMSTPNSLVLELAEVGSGMGLDKEDEERATVPFSSGPSSPLCGEVDSSSGSSNQFLSSCSPSSSLNISSCSPRHPPSSPSPPADIDSSTLLETGRDPSAAPSTSSSDSDPPETSISKSLLEGITPSSSPVSASLSPSYRPSVSLPDEASLELLCSSFPTTSSSTLSLTKSKVQLDLDSATPMPTNFIDSLLSSPTYYHHSHPPKEEVTPTVTDPRSTADRKVLLLLSRVSHMRDCLPFLASPEHLPVILDYFFTAETTDVHCFKVLSRVFSNPHCFQDCLLNLAPSLTLDHMSSVAVTSTSSSSSSFSASPLSPHLVSAPLVDTDSMFHYPTSCSPLSPPQHPDDPSSVLNLRQDACQQLFDKLSRVAESPYGQGVIAHMLLRGGSREVNAGALSLTLLQRSVPQDK